MKQYDVAIIGAGPAGLTAGLYCARYGLKTAIIEKALVGGTAVLAGHIWNYPGYKDISGIELMNKFRENAEGAGAEIVQSAVTETKASGKEKELVLEEETIKAKVVIVAVGAKSKWLKVKGEKEFMTKGVHSCATCDGPLYKGKEVAIIGSDNRAVEEALYLATVAKKTYLISEKKELNAEKANLEMLSQKKVELLLGTTVVEFRGKGFLEEVVVREKGGKLREVKINGAFVYAGTEPNTEFIDVKKDKEGKINVNEKMETSVKGVFAAGDCIEKELYQITTGVGEGATAAHSASKYIQENF